MNTDLIATALKRDYISVFERSDDALESLSHLVVTLPLRMLAYDSVQYVRFISGKLALMFPEVHDEMLMTARVWENFILGSGPRMDVKRRITMIAHLRKEARSNDEIRLLNALSHYLRINEGEHHYMEATLLYLTSVLRRRWEAEGISACSDVSRKEIADEVTEGLMKTKEVTCTMKKSEFGAAFTMEEYNTELLYRIKLREQSANIVRKAETDRMKEIRRRERNSDRQCREKILRKKELLLIQSGRARASSLYPSEVKPELRTFEEVTDMDVVVRVREKLVEMLHEEAPETDNDISFLLEQNKQWLAGRITKAALRRKCASFMINLIKTENMKAIYTAEALALSFTKDPKGLKFIVDTALVPWCDSLEEVMNKLKSVMKVLGISCCSGKSDVIQSDT